MAVAVFRNAALIGLVCAACTSIAVDARTFEGTRWRVTAINGRATPANGDYRLQFERGKISGRFGCNGFGGRYSVRRDQLIAREIASTLMGCPEPAMSFEAAGLRVLAGPARLSWTSSARLMLSNRAGSIALKRVR